MAKIDGIILEIENHIGNANVVKDIVLARLVMDKVISEEMAQDYSENWQIIVIKPSWFKKWFDKFRKPKGIDDIYEYKYVRFEERENKT
jgi:hypothetical protein